MLSDPAFYFVAIPAVLLYGVAKGGFGGAIAILAVPLMTLVMPPAQAAAILLPILVVMDMVAIYTYRGHFDGLALRLLLPGAVLGVCIGYLLAEYLNDEIMRLIVGSVAVVFGLQFLAGMSTFVGSTHHRPTAMAFGTLAGFTSFSIHAGGPPFTMYLIPKGVAPFVYAGTAALFFSVVNLAKLPAYWALGQFTQENLIYSAVLIPVAPLGVLLGRKLVGLSNPQFYYRLIAAFLVVIGLKLIYDGVTGL
ncbi:MAG: sulfite exporter TauE/SafE family protein [Pseudomonadota bacterium]